MPVPAPPICDYEGSDYQSSFWDQGGRQYEDRAEAIALMRLLPKGGRLLLELGAGAGRNTPRYSGFDRVVLLDYSRSQLAQAQARLGRGDRYIYVAADANHLPFLPALFDAATMIRVLHHMADAPGALAQVCDCLRPDAIFILEFANKRNLKSVVRFWFGQQSWNPFSPEPIEFAKLNFNFHPRTVRQWVNALGLRVERSLTVSHFRNETLKKMVPAAALAFLDSLLQHTGAVWQYSPSVFLRLEGGNKTAPLANAFKEPAGLFKCPRCGHTPLEEWEDRLTCGHCGAEWGIHDGIYDLRTPLTEFVRAAGS